MNRLRFSSGNVVSGIVLAALGLFIIAEARQWNYMSPDGPGAGFFPMWYGIAMVVLALLLVGGEFVRGTTAGTATPVNWRGIRRALIAWAAFAVGVALLKVLGFVVSFGLITLFIVSGMYGQRLRVALAVAVCSALAFYLVFPLALQVGLPVGIFGF